MKMIDYKEAYNKIAEALEAEIPFALIRIGDGEYMTASGERRDYVLKRQWGHVPSQEDQEIIGELVKDAYIDADIIGIPTKFHIEQCGSYWARAYEYFTQQRPVIKDIPTCSIDAHSEMFKDGLLDKLLQDRDELIYISGRNLDEQFHKHYNIKEVKSFVVNAEQVWETRKSRNHWPYQFKMVEEWINVTDVKGKLCLCGAGVLGKWYTHLLKRNGAIAIDAGHIFDMWHGIITRGKGRGTKSDKYKL